MSLPHGFFVLSPFTFPPYFATMEQKLSIEAEYLQNRKRRKQSDFYYSILNDTAQLIYKLQAKHVEDYNLIKSGDLLDSLKRGHFSVDSSDSGGRFVMHYFPYMRALDRKPHEKYHAYNRIVFGIIYRKTYSELRNGAVEHYSSILKRQIEDAYNLENQ